MENAYKRSVTREGNLPARKLVRDVFEVCDRTWRGIGVIPKSGLCLSEGFTAFDAKRRFDSGHIRTDESRDCIAGRFCWGTRNRTECAAFGGKCTPDHPLGAPMVSAEGACAAYFSYRRTP